MRDLVLDLAKRDHSRRLKNWTMIALMAVASAVAIAPLMSVLFYIVRQGIHSLSWTFLSSLPKPVGEPGGGIANAAVGSGYLILLASSIGIPWGVFLGVFLAEHAGRKLAKICRFFVDILSSIPSIVIGIFVYSLVVVPMKSFSALAGGVALALIMIPTVAKTTEELLKMVPTHLREAGLALGLPRWKVQIRIVLRGIMGGIFTGVILAVARVGGESAPLLFTALNNQYWSLKASQPIASLPVQIYTYAISPYEDWHRQAWSGALVLVALVLVLNLVTRLMLYRGKRGRSE